MKIVRMLANGTNSVEIETWIDSRQMHSFTGMDIYHERRSFLLKPFAGTITATNLYLEE